MVDRIGSLIIDIEGTDLSPEEREMIAHPLVGGVILFSRNYASRQQLQLLNEEMRAARQHPLIIMVDQEGGRVQRFMQEFTRLPAMASLGKRYDENAKAACLLAKNYAWLMATEILSVGVDLSLAPVLDLHKGVSSVIGQRAFHANPQVVIELAHAFIQGMREAGMAATGKHFPGHGSVTLDSHLALPTDRRSLNDIEQEDMVPFAGMIKAGVAAIMAAHIVFPEVDTLPVGYSRRWLQTILRDRLGFVGVVFSDDLTMEGANISSSYVDRMIAAREAGCDFTLVCNQRAAVIDILDHVSHVIHCVKKEKWGALLGRLTCEQPYQHTKRWQETHAFLLETAQMITE